MTTLQNVTKIVDVTHLVRPPSELEQARRHLLECQEELAESRRSIGDPPGYFKSREAVLAALSWVWDAQERDAAWQVWLAR